MSVLIQRRFQDATSIESHAFSGPLINFLQQHFPQGFGEYEGVVSLNGKTLSVDDYDMMVRETDSAIILLLPGEATFWTAFIKTVLINLAVAAITYLLMPKPKSNKDRTTSFLTINSQQNVPKLGEPIPVQYGRVVSYPPVAAQPYIKTDPIKNIQHLHQILCLGQGDFDVEKIELGTTDISSFAKNDVEVHIVPYALHQGKLGYIEANYGVKENVYSSYEVQGVTMGVVGDAEWLCRAQGTLWNRCDSKYEIPSWWAGLTNKQFIVRYRGDDAYPISLATASFGAVGSKTTTFFTRTTNNTLTYPVGTWLSMTLVDDDDGWRGWFNACMPTQTVTQIDLDFFFQGGLRFTDSDGDHSPQSVRIDIEWQAIDDNDVPTGAVQTKFIVVKKNTGSPFVYTDSITVPARRYQVRCRRTTRDAKSYNEQSEFVWSSLRGHVVFTAGQKAYGKVTLLVVKLRASARVVEAARDKIRVTSVRKLPTIQTSFATIAPTINPIDAVCDIMRAEYGGKFPLANLDIPALTSAAAKFAPTAGFNYIFDQQTTVWDALQVSLQAHRAQPVAYNQKLSVRLNEKPTVSKALFSRENYLENSFKMAYRMGDPLEIDGVEVGYYDPITWSQRTIRWPTTSVVPERIEALGVSYQPHALAHAQWSWLVRSAIKRGIEFSTELDASILEPGDRIEVASPFVSFVMTGRVMNVAGNALTLDQFVPAGTYHVYMRDVLGAPHGPTTLVHTGGNIITMPALPFTPNVPLDGVEATHIVLGAVNTATKQYIVQSVSPGGLQTDVGASEYIEDTYTEYPVPSAPTPPLPPAGPVIRSAPLTIPELALSGATVTRNVYFHKNGYVADYNSGNPTNWGDWITPNHVDIGASYQIKITVVSGVFFNQASWNGIMQQLANTPAISIQQVTVGSTTGVVKCEFFDLLGTKLGEFTCNIPVRRIS